MRFSQRMGYTPLSKVIQIDSMDEELRTSIWNCLVTCYWDGMSDRVASNTDVYKFFKKLWESFLKLPVDEVYDSPKLNVITIRVKFKNWKWYEVYDFIEYMAECYPVTSNNNAFIDQCNSVLEREMSAYRFAGGKLIRSTTELEIEEIETVLTNTSTDRFLPVRLHLEQSLQLLTDRRQPDFRNSIKESISAVESICKIILDDPKTTLGKALTKLEKSSEITIHSSLKESFNKLYGYTSDADGIRHALLDESNLSFDDAKYILVSCTAFINYIISKLPKKSHV